MTRRVAAITGASSGIGEAYARKLAADYNLILIARRQERLDQLASELSKAHGCHVEVIAADLTLDQNCQRVANRLSNEPQLAILVNNAGFGTRGRFWETSVESQVNMHQLHVMATMRLTHAALGNMVSRNEGAVINVASISSFMRFQGGVSYAATKSWMAVFTEGLYLELRGKSSNVIVQALCPGYTISEFQSVKGVRENGAGSSPFWMTADAVVTVSLDALLTRKLFVIPGWRYRWFTAFVSILPTRARLAFELLGSRTRPQEIEKPTGGLQKRDLPLA